MVVIRPMTCQNTLNMLFYKWLATSLSRLLMLFVGVDLLFLLFPLLLNPRVSNAPCMNTNCVLSLGTSFFAFQFPFILLLSSYYFIHPQCLYHFLSFHCPFSLSPLYSSNFNFHG